MVAGFILAKQRAKSCCYGTNNISVDTAQNGSEKLTPKSTSFIISSFSFSDNDRLTTSANKGTVHKKIQRAIILLIVVS